MRRRGHLGEFEILLIVALAACGVGLIAGAWQLVARVPITVAVQGTPTLSGLAPGVRPEQAGPVAVIVDDPTGSQVAWEALRTAPWFALIVFTLVMLLLVVRSARRGEPFSDANIQRLALTGWVLLVGSALAFVLELIAVTELSESVSVSGALSGGATYSFVWAFSSLGFLAVAEVLKRGRAIQADLAGVV
ncbi:DUF2975 domain-containing protein [Cryptosporangium arvum]|uniref:DUF2975 domain-containing protein n=1 Tax=Cryptosporangium arvum TaxID=80871 RepID=UPI0004B4F287|nr:DUF2975 domain-containing protein [Cryptosporangium arvum]